MKKEKLSFVIEGFCKRLYVNHIGVFAMTITNDSIKKRERKWRIYGVIFRILRGKYGLKCRKQVKNRRKKQSLNAFVFQQKRIEIDEFIQKIPLKKNFSTCLLGD